jgi:RNA polymerase sigma factor (sigma-70 family)
LKSISRQEAEYIVANLISLRNKSKRSKSEKVHKEYKKAQQLCADKLDFLVDRKTKKYRGFSNYEDLKQDGRLALVLGLNSYKPDKGDIFYWLNQYIKTKISREANRHSTIKIPIKHARRTQPYKVSQLPIIVDNGPGALNTIENSEVHHMLYVAISELPKEQQKIIRLHYELDGWRSHSITKICKELKISRINCIKLLNEAKENLRKTLDSLER